MDMLPAHRTASPPTLQSSREQPHDDGLYPMLDSSRRIEVEANNPRKPELDAEAPGPQIMEIETAEPALEMYTQEPVGELEGESRQVV